MSVTRAGSLFHKASPHGSGSAAREASGSSDVAGPRFGDESSSKDKDDAAHTAGEPSVYDNGLVSLTMALRLAYDPNSDLLW